MTHKQGIDVLTDPDELLGADRADLLLAVARAGAQVRSTVERAAPLPADLPRGVLVTGPTAARDIALLQALAGPGAAPFATLDPTGTDASVLPSWVGALDLVVVLAADRDDAPAAEIAAQARHRGAALVVRGADAGPVADAAGPALISPGVPTPEGLALPGRLALLMLVASSAGLMPAIDLGEVSAALDAEALACGPAAENFTNPALALAQALWANSPLFLGSDPVGRALAAHAAGSLTLLAGVPAAAESGSVVLRAPQLLARAGRPRDLFADPFADEGQDGTGGAAAPSIAPVLIAPVPGAGESAAATHRALQRALPRALLVADGATADAAASWAGPGSNRSADTPAGSGGDRGAGRPGSGGESSPLTRRVAAAMRMALRIDYAAVYLGIASGQLAPADAPEGLGPAGSVPPRARPATVEDVTGDDRDRAGSGAGATGATAATGAADPWDESTWN